MARAASQLIVLSLFAAPLIDRNVVADLLNHLKSNGTGVRAASLRRQLIANNYDYTSSVETEESPRRPAAPAAALAAAPAAAPAPGPLNLVPRAVKAQGAATLIEFNSDAPPDDIPKDDRLYYVDDDRLGQHLRGSAEPGLRSATPKAKFKILKVGAASGRRAGGREARRFLREQRTDGGAALVKLGGKPFPPVRLPAARRQYMSDADSDLEMAPLIDLSDRMVRGFGEHI